MSEASLISILDNMPIGLIIFDRSGSVVFANRLVKGIFSYEILGESIGKIFLDINIEGALFSQIEGNQNHFCFFVGDKQSIAEVSLVQSFWQDEPATYAYISNIADHVGVQQALRNKESQYQLLMESIDDGVCSISLSGRVIYANDSAARILSYENAELIGQSYTTVFDFDEAEDLISLLHNAGDHSIRNERRVRVSGVDIVISYTLLPLKSDSSIVNGAIIVFRNIGDKTAYEANLAQQNELISLGLDAADIGSWEWEIDTGEVSLSPKLYQILDVPASTQNWSIRDFQKVIYRQDISQVEIVDLMARKTFEATDICCRVIKSDGAVIWITGKYRYFSDDKGRIFRARGVAWDSTEEMLLQEDNHRKTEALKRSNKELDDFAYIASHDLKEPLRGISNYANFLLDDYSKHFDAEGLHMLSSLVRLSNRMDGLISDLLSYSKLGRTDLAYGLTNIDAIVVGVIELIIPIIEEKNVHIIYESQLENVVCDQVRMREVFRNLITNAIKYNKNDTREIYLGSYRDDNSTVFYVKDNGIGIPSDLQAMVFDIFKRLHGFSEFGGGTGIGLSIVKKVVDQHRGKLWMSSQEGQGSTFYFSIPNRKNGFPASI